MISPIKSINKHRGNKLLSINQNKQNHLAKLVCLKFTTRRIRQSTVEMLCKAFAANV